MSAPARCPASYFTRDDIPRLDNAAYVANRRGDRCGWFMLCELSSHLRDALWDPMPWLRDDSYAQTYFLPKEPRSTVP